jgi:hypothetical protein
MFFILWVNDPPVAVVTCPETVNEGAIVTLDGNGSSDSDDGIASYAWNQLEGLPNADLSEVDLSSSIISFTVPQLTSQLNTMKFKLIVTDKGGLQSSAECDVTVLDVTPPVISGADDITAEATSAQLQELQWNLALRQPTLLTAPLLSLAHLPQAALSRLVRPR